MFPGQNQLNIQSTPAEWAVRKGGGLTCHARLKRSPSGAPYQSFSMSYMSNQLVHFCLAYLFTLKVCLQVGNEFWEICPSNIPQFLSLQPCMQSMSPVQLSCLLVSGYRNSGGLAPAMFVLYLAGSFLHYTTVLADLCIRWLQMALLSYILSHIIEDKIMTPLCLSLVVGPGVAGAVL